MAARVWQRQRGLDHLGTSPLQISGFGFDVANEGMVGMETSPPILPASDHLRGIILCRQVPGPVPSTVALDPRGPLDRGPQDDPGRHCGRWRLLHVEAGWQGLWASES